MDNRISVGLAAKLLNTSEQFVRMGLQQGVFPFGYAVKTSTRWTYVILKNKFEEETGLKTRW